MTRVSSSLINLFCEVGASIPSRACLDDSRLEAIPANPAWFVIDCGRSESFDVEGTYSAEVFFLLAFRADPRLGLSWWMANSLQVGLD